MPTHPCRLLIRFLRVAGTHALFALLLGAVATGAHAQIVLDGTLGPATVLTGPNYRIGAELGQLRGSNLYHSFSDFVLRGGETATFAGPAGILNIVSRVTGGRLSTIDGLLVSEIAGANLHFLNPAGVQFGANARLNLGGSLHVSSANYLRFSDNVRFPTDASIPGVLSAASPVAFGFLGPSAPLTVQGSILQVPTGQALTLAGGDIQVSGARLQAVSGRINLASLAGAGEVVPGSLTDPPSLVVDAAPRGAMSFSGGSLVTVRGNPGGTVLIRSGSLTYNSAFVSATSTGAVNHPGTGVDIDVTGAMRLVNGSEIAASSLGTGRGGGIRIVAGQLEMIGDPVTHFASDIATRASSFGRGGDIDITADTMVVKGGAFINTPSLGPGTGGNLIVRARDLQLLDVNGQAFISTGAFSSGNAGSLTVEAQSFLATGGANGFTGLANTIETGGNAVAAGPLRVTAGDLTLLDGAQITGSMFSGRGQGGAVEVTADRITIAGVNPFGFRAGIFADMVGANARGIAGNVLVTAGDIQVSRGGIISASLFGGSPGTAGTVTVNANRLELRERGLIAASSVFGSGRAGAVEVNSNELVITGIATTLDPVGPDFTGISTGTNAGAGGDIRITGRSVLVDDQGLITATSIGPGAAGKIEIQLGAGSLTLLDGGSITSSALGTGPGGSIQIGAGDVLLAGAAPFNPNVVGLSAIAAQASTGGGNAGDIRITANSVRLLDGAKLLSNTFGHGSGGNIEVTAGSLVVSGFDANVKAQPVDGPRNPAAAGSAIDATSARALLPDAMGRPGNIRLSVGTLEVSNEGVIFNQTRTPAPGGSIDILANGVSLSGGSLVSAQSLLAAGGGKAGDITMSIAGSLSVSGSTVSTSTVSGEGGTIAITASQVDLSGATIAASSSGTGNAGNILISASDAFRSFGSAVTTQALLADGGDITFHVGRLLHLVDSRITTAVGSGTGQGGNITIDPQFVILDGSQIRADAFGGPGGNVNIVADIFLMSPDSVISASSQLGTSGTVTVQAGVTDVAGALGRLPESALAASELLRQSCEVRLGMGRASSFVLAARDGLPIEPGNLLPSVLETGRAAAVARVSPERSGRVAVGDGGRPRVSALLLALACTK